LKILSIDTASNICGVSILDDTHSICKLDQDTGRTHSENLMPMIQQAFKQSNLTLKDIDLLVCDKGPGSFTGIRIGVATVKAFHDSLKIPCIGISSLEALAYSVKKDGFIASIMDCKNDNCYFALYELKNSKYIEIMSPTADTITNALKICHQNIFDDSSITFVGDGSEIYKNIILKEFENCIFADLENNLLDSYYVGLAGLSKYQENKFEDVLPLYLKKPQAQRQLEDKLKNIEISSMTLENLNQIANNLISDFDEFWTYDILKGELNSENSNYIIARFNHEIVGFAGIKIMLDEADIMNIVVKKDFRNQGIATLLLENLIHLSKELNLNSITLEVMEENYPAIHLYKKLGFEQIGLRKNYYKDKNGLIMKKQLKN
jgi:tRNA threonylcarbamoyladenosine biosynthesis protein TsaB